MSVNLTGIHSKRMAFLSTGSAHCKVLHLGMTIQNPVTLSFGPAFGSCNDSNASSYSYIQWDILK